MNQRYDPISTLMSFQHQANHYRHIVNPRKTTINFMNTDQQRKNKRIFSYLESKFEKEKKQTIKKENLRIFNDILQITRKNGILQKAEQQFRSLESRNRKSSLVNPYKAKQQEQKIRKQNLKLKAKIIQLKPLVGQKIEWKKHQKFNEQQINKLRSKSFQMRQTLTAQNILKAVLQSKKNKGQGPLNLYHTLSLRKQENELDSAVNKKVTTGRSKKRTKNKKAKKQRSAGLSLKESLECSEILNHEEEELDIKNKTVNLESQDKKQIKSQTELKNQEAQ